MFSAAQIISSLILRLPPTSLVYNEYNADPIYLRHTSGNCSFAFFTIVSLYGFFVAVRPTKIHSSVTPADFELDFKAVTIETADGIKEYQTRIREFFQKNL